MLRIPLSPRPLPRPLTVREAAGTEAAGCGLDVGSSNVLAATVYSESTPISKMRSRTGTSNEVGDAERPKSIRKVTRPVSATAPPGRRPSS